MAGRQFKAIKGNTTVKIDPQYQDLFDDIVKKAFPDIAKTLESTVKEIKKDAERQWPVRQRKSKRSVDQFEIRFGLTNNGITVSLENDAPYAGGILAGRLTPSLNVTGQETSVPEGKLVWWHLLYLPAIGATDKLIKQLGNELMREMRRA